jgi:hypothetical protein
MRIRSMALSRSRWIPQLAGLAALAGAGLLAAGCTQPTAQLAPEPAATSTAEVATLAPAASGVTAYPAPGTPARTAELAKLAGVAQVDIVEDWEDYATVDQVEDTISRNLGIGDNLMDLTLERSDGQTLPPGQVLAVAYDITSSAPDDFVGFNRDLGAAADWSGGTALAIWIDGSQAPDVDVVLQFRETSGEVWRSQQPLPSMGQPLVLPLDTDTFQRTDWSASVNDQIDLGAIDQYGLYVGHTGPGRSGAAKFGPIVLVR